MLKIKTILCEEKLLRKITLLAAVVNTVLCTLPVMSAHLNGGESGTLVVRGYNLMEFSAWGCIPMIAPLLMAALLLCWSELVREAGLLSLFAGNLVCYVHSFNAAKAWLAELSGVGVSYHPVMLLYPLAFVVLFVLAEATHCVSKTTGGVLWNCIGKTGV